MTSQPAQRGVAERAPFLRSKVQILFFFQPAAHSSLEAAAISDYCAGSSKLLLVYCTGTSYDDAFNNSSQQQYPQQYIQQRSHAKIFPISFRAKTKSQRHQQATTTNAAAAAHQSTTDDVFIVVRRIKNINITLQQRTSATNRQQQQSSAAGGKEKNGCTGTGIPFILYWYPGTVSRSSVSQAGSIPEGIFVAWLCVVY